MCCMISGRLYVLFTVVSLTPGWCLVCSDQSINIHWMNTWTNGINKLTLKYIFIFIFFFFSIFFNVLRLMTDWGLFIQYFRVGILILLRCFSFNKNVKHVPEKVRNVIYDGHTGRRFLFISFFLESSWICLCVNPADKQNPKSDI